MDFSDKINFLNGLGNCTVTSLDGTRSKAVFSDGVEIITIDRLPEGCTVEFVPGDDEFMMAADKKRYDSGCFKQQTGAVIVLDGKIIGSGCNDGELQTSCERVNQNCETGTGYHLCKEFCKQFRHAERDTILKTLEAGVDPTGGKLYLSGHWWACADCWRWMMEVGITTLVMDEEATTKFTHPVPSLFE